MEKIFVLASYSLYIGRINGFLWVFCWNLKANMNTTWAVGKTYFVIYTSNVYIYILAAPAHLFITWFHTENNFNDERKNVIINLWRSYMSRVVCLYVFYNVFFGFYWQNKLFFIPLGCNNLILLPAAGIFALSMYYTCLPITFSTLRKLRQCP